MTTWWIFVQIIIIIEYYVYGIEIYVNENSTDVLRCPFKVEIGSRIDWVGPPSLTTYTLGKDVNQNLPQKDRISVVGQTDSGEFNLQISTIQPSDRGEYQCSSPGTGLQVDSIVLKLTVPPESGPSLSRNQSGFIFVGDTILLKCEVNGGTPLAKIDWQCDGVKGERNSSTGNKIESFVDLTVKESDNNKNCTCIANHPSWTSLKSVNILLNIFFAPDTNLTIQRKPAGGIISGNKVNLTCIASGGNPLATLSWNCSGTNYRYTTENTVSYSVEFEVDNSDNNKLCICSATHDVISYKSQAQNMLIVYYAPMTNPVIEQKPLGGIPVGDTVTLTCIVPGGNPLATLFWNCTGLSKNETVIGTASYSIEFNVSKSLNNKICACTASHKVNNYNPTVQHNLVVFYAPSDRPSIQQTPPGGINTGNTVTLTCSVKGGNPLVLLRWNCTGDMTNSTTDTTANYSVSFTVNKAQNKAICTCSAMHPIQSYRHVVEHSLDVYYVPSTNPLILQTPSGGILTGKNVTLTCSVSGGNPLAILSWNCTGTKWNNTAGNRASYSITLYVDKSYNNKICRCTADHVISTYKPTVQQNLVVYYAPDVNPSIQQRPPDGIITGRTVTLTCSVKGGNPPAILRWNCSGDIINSTTDTTANYSVSFTVNKTQDNAICSCSASHPVTSYIPVTEHNLVVYFAPDVTVYRNLSDIEEGKTLELNCIAIGKPSINQYLWRHLFHDKVIRTFQRNSRTLVLTNLSYQDIGHYECIVNNGIEDLQGRLNQTNEINIEVKYRPVFVHFNTYITAKVGKEVNAEVEFITFPDTNGVVLWKNSTDDPIVTNSSNLFTTLHSHIVNLTIYGENVSFDTFSYRSALVLPKFEISQAGSYSLQVNNTVGVNTKFLQVIVSDRPKPPTQFGASVIGSTSVTLTWTSGYNGGNEQTFIITYWEINSEDRRSKNVTENSENKYYEEIIQDLLPSTTYMFVIDSTNVEGISYPANNTISYKTEGISAGTQSSILGPVGGSIGGTIFVILIIITAIFIMRKQSVGRKRRKTDRKNLTFTSREEDDEDGLRDNELYVSAGDDINPCAEPGDVYAVVDKSNGKKSNAKQKVQETGLYAEVNKNKDAPRKATEDSNAKNQNKLKTNRKEKTKIEKKRNDDVYENLGEGNHRQIDSTNKNKDGLVYADLVFNNDGKRKFVIRGIENKTDYADVDLSIKVDPLPSDESDVEDEQVNKSSGVVQKPQ